jgi:hypothetical protein
MGVGGCFHKTSFKFKVKINKRLQRFQSAHFSRQPTTPTLRIIVRGFVLYPHTLKKIFFRDWNDRIGAR